MEELGMKKICIFMMTLAFVGRCCAAQEVVHLSERQVNIYRDNEKFMDILHIKRFELTDCNLKMERLLDEIGLVENYTACGVMDDEGKLENIYKEYNKALVDIEKIKDSIASCESALKENTALLKKSKVDAAAEEKQPKVKFQVVISRGVTIAIDGEDEHSEVSRIENISKESRFRPWPLYRLRANAAVSSFQLIPTLQSDGALRREDSERGTFEMTSPDEQLAKLHEMAINSAHLEKTTKDKQELLRRRSFLVAIRKGQHLNVCALPTIPKRALLFLKHRVILM